MWVNPYRGELTFLWIENKKDSGRPQTRASDINLIGFESRHLFAKNRDNLRKKNSPDTLSFPFLSLVKINTKLLSLFSLIFAYADIEFHPVFFSTKECAISGQRKIPSKYLNLGRTFQGLKLFVLWQNNVIILQSSLDSKRAQKALLFKTEIRWRLHRSWLVKHIPLTKSTRLF